MFYSLAVTESRARLRETLCQRAIPNGRHVLDQITHPNKKVVLKQHVALVADRIRLLQLLWQGNNYI